jgi:hypothetical protein
MLTASSLWWHRSLSGNMHPGYARATDERMKLRAAAEGSFADSGRPF